MAAERAVEAKERGNKAFKNKSFHAAIDAYTEAIDLDPQPAYYCNRAFAYLKTEAWGAAVNDANEAMNLGHLKASRRDFEAVLKVKPSDKDAQQKLKGVEKMIHQLAFAKAIAVEHNTISAVEKLRQNLENL